MQPQENLPQGTVVAEHNEITIARTNFVTQERGSPVEWQIFTMTIGGELIQLVPFKNWEQLDHHKWLARGKLPASPAGLEITPAHVKLGGETVPVEDPDACHRLQKAANEWLNSERSTRELARQKAHPDTAKPTTPTTRPAKPEPVRLGYKVEMDKEKQVHIRCFHGKEMLAEVGLSVLGINSLVTQGLMHKPGSFKVGALHDWIEIDGVLYSFEKGRNDSDLLERVLNERYLSNAALGQGKNVVVYANAASSTGFDIQFDVAVGGVPDRRRRPLNEETLELLQDQHRCGVLHKDLVIKLTRPTLVFKRKTPEGGEEYLVRCPENIVTVVGDGGQAKEINLSQPVNYLHLSAVELTTVFNHPAINQHARQASPVKARIVNRTESQSAPSILPPEPVGEERKKEPHPAETPAPLPALPVAIPAPISAQPECVQREPEPQPAPQHNSWLAPLLPSQAVPPEGFTQLLYCKLAEFFGNSEEIQFASGVCWTIALGETNDPDAPEFRGLFLTEKGSLGFLNHGHIARFYKAVAFVGMQESALEGIDVVLLGVGLDEQQRLLFVVSDGFEENFGVPHRILRPELERLEASGAVILTCQQALQSPEPIEILWTFSAEESNELEITLIECRRPEPLPSELAPELTQGCIETLTASVKQTEARANP